MGAKKTNGFEGEIGYDGRVEPLFEVLLLFAGGAEVEGVVGAAEDDGFGACGCLGATYVNVLFTDPSSPSAKMESR
jgi:hypothetical protein